MAIWTSKQLVVYRDAMPVLIIVCFLTSSSDHTVADPLFAGDSLELEYPVYAAKTVSIELPASLLVLGLM